MVAVTLPADFTTLNFFDCRDPGCFHSMLAHFISGVWWWNHVSSPVTMHLRNPWPLLAYCCRNERAQAFAPYGFPIVMAAPILRTPCGILPCVWSWQWLCVTGSSCVGSSLTVILLFSRIAFSTHLLVWCVCSCCSAASLTVCSVLKHAHHFATLTSHHIVPVNLDQPTKKFCCTFVAFRNWIIAQTLHLDYCSSCITMFIW
jgi:hypothetical protein